ncbi:MAG: N-acetylmuramoyl-L-alanine amidase [Legionellales bacterium]|nr:N-acetylmuramoyl-L-alanine amidase [Legionellales bacterium]
MLVTINHRCIIRNSLLLILLFLIADINAKNINSVHNVKLQNTPRYTKLKIKFTRLPKYKLYTTHNASRVVLELDNAKTKYNFQKLSIDNTFLKNIRSYQDKNKLRIVFHVINNATYKDRYKKQDKELEIVFYKLDNAPPKKSRKHARKKVAPLRDIRILIDPGHGGHDPGVIGQYGLREKDVTLRVSLLLKEIINREPGLVAILTRNSDRYLHIRKRLQHARKKSSDLFLSIHADGFNNQSCKGASVYVLSRHGATTEAARWVAARENYSVLGGNIDLKHKDSFLRTMLYDLSQTATLAASTKMASSILRELSTVTSLHSKRIEKGPFAVLKSPDIPSVLIELGFLSNVKEEKKLRKVKNCRLLARAIFSGIIKYLKANPIKGTCYGSKYYRHIVKKGDNLAKIAKKYSTRVPNIMKMNNLTTTVLKPGMELRIPKIS